MPSETSIFKLLPSVDRVLQSGLLASQLEEVGQHAAKNIVRRKLELLREGISRGDQHIVTRLQSAEFFDEFCAEISEELHVEFTGTLKPVFNLSGTVVHTNLGRARLPRSAIAAMTIVATEATNLEFDLVSGKRGDRDTHIEKAICELTGAEAATVVNNNAAAVLLVLNTLAYGKEVLISRGELVEIGGAFRIPDVMASAGCTLKEIGTTNRTHLSDYSKAIGSDTGLLMKVHTSNYEIRGFTKSVSENDLSQLARERGLAFVSDLGSGTLVDLTQYGLPEEPTVSDVLKMGADLVTFSGDKLLGGPQAGIIVGKKELIEQIKQNPLKRALRVDKICLAALTEVLNIYKDPQRLTQRLPMLADLTRDISDINSVAEQILPALDKYLAGKAKLEIQNCKSQIGSGALPLELLDSRAIAIEAVAEKGQRDALLNNIAADFRSLQKPVIGRINDGKLYFDLRCLRDVDGFLAQLAI